MTSNIQPGKHFNVGFQDKAESRTAIQHEVKARFRAEFINRVDEQIVFRPLSEEDARRRMRKEERGKRNEERSRHLLHPPSSIFRPASSLSCPPSCIFIPPSSVLVQAPLSGLILSGRLKEHESWQVVRGEEGLVVVPVVRKAK
jgi:hypothetical protein